MDADPGQFWTPFDSSKSWGRQFLQVRWQPADIADESLVAQLVFGRADAWTDWNRYPVDRPVASFWHVLVSIGGLFRPRGRSIAISDLDGTNAGLKTVENHM